MDLTDFSELIEKLSDLIAEWMKTRKHASMSMLARLTGVNVQTLKKYAEKEVREPSLDVVTALCRVLLPREKYGQQGPDLILKFFPDVGYYVKDHDVRGFEPMVEIGTLDDFTKNDFLVLTLAGAQAGLSHDLAVNKLGQEAAEDSIEKLLTAGILRRDGDIYRSSREFFQVLGVQRVLDEIVWLCEIFNTKLIDRRGSLYRLITQGLSDEAIVKIHKILYTAAEQIDDIVIDPMNHGNNVMGYGIVSTFVHSENKGQGA